VVHRCSLLHSSGDEDVIQEPMDDGAVPLTQHRKEVGAIIASWLSIDRLESSLWRIPSDQQIANNEEVYTGVLELTPVSKDIGLNSTSTLLFADRCGLRESSSLWIRSDQQIANVEEVYIEVELTPVPKDIFRSTISALTSVETTLCGGVIKPVRLR
jgi:hypothetical protein